MDGLMVFTWWRQCDPT